MSEREYQQEISLLAQKLGTIKSVLNLEAMAGQVALLEQEAGNPNLWDDPENATRVTSRLSRSQNEISQFAGLENRLNDLPILIDLAKDENDSDALKDAERELDELTKRIEELEVRTLLNGEYDSRDALVTIRSQAGGVEAADWAQMLFRMYTRWCERHSHKFDVLDTSYAEEAGIKSSPSE